MTGQDVQADDEEDEFSVVRPISLEVKILEKNDTQLRFMVQGIDLSVANALRRAMIAEVSSMAIDDVFIIENSSTMEDEILAHRLGLVPLKTDLKSYVMRDKCDCHSESGCNKCAVTFTLEAEASGSTRTVYSKELKSSDSQVVPVNGDIPLLKLANNQRVRLEAYARLGMGTEHAKWQPVTVCTVRPTSTILIDEKCDACQRCVEVCFPQVLRIKEGVLVIEDYEKCNSCKRCEESCPNGAIHIERSKDAFVFTIESSGVLPPESIFDSAIDLLKDKAQEFISHVTSLKTGGENDETEQS